MVLRPGPLCVAALLVLAGCSGIPGAETPTAETPEHETTASTVGGTTNPDASTSDATALDATTTASTPSSTTRVPRANLDAKDLSRSDRELLRRAVENGSIRVTRANLSGDLTPDTDGWEVRYRGALYRLSWERTGLRGEYHLESARVVNDSAVDGSRDAIAYDNLTAEARELFDAARSGNDTDSYGADAFPDQLREHGYVIHDGDYYELRVTVGDYVLYRLTVTEIES